MLLLTIALFASAAFAAPQVDVQVLNKVVDAAVAEIAVSQPQTINKVTVEGLSSLKRTNCMLKDGIQYECVAVADKLVLKYPEGELKAVAKVPITTILSADGKVEKFIVGQVEIEETEENANDGLFKHFWKKVKKAAHKVVKGTKKTVKTAGKIVSDAAKRALDEKAHDIANKVINGAIGAVVGK